MGMGRSVTTAEAEAAAAASAMTTRTTRRHVVSRVWLRTLAAVNDANYVTIITVDIYWR
jgi:hypothetical protein